MSAARTICDALGGTWSGRSGLACCPAHDDDSPSLSVSEGNDGRPLLHCFAGCSFGAVTDALKARGLWPPQKISGTCRHATRKILDDDDDAQRKREIAQQLWDESENMDDTVLWRYLRRRGFRGGIPSSLRFHPDTYHGPAGRSFPAMIAKVTRWPSSDLVAVHRTYLDEDGRGKADVVPNKMSLGKTRGGAVRLARCADSRTLVLAEGIETALAAMQLSGHPAWALLSAGNFQHVVLPDHVTEILIAADHDRAGLTAARRLRDRLFAEGRTVKVAVAPGDGNDWADIAKIEMRRQA